MSNTDQQFYEFGPFRLDAAKRVLRRDGEVVALAPKAFDMLLVLVRHPGEVLEKDRLLAMLWPDSEVEEANLPQNVSALRKALGESPNERRYIATVPGRGYKFAAEVRASPGEDAEVVIGRYSKATVVVEEQEENPGSLRGDALPVRPAVPQSLQRWRLSRRTLLTFGILAVGSLALYLWLSQKSKGSPPAKTIQSVAVLPFQSLNTESEDVQALGVGVTDTLITKLSNLKEIVVRPTSTVLRYSRQQKAPADIGKELAVEAVLEGSIRRAGDRVRVTVRLLNVADGSPVWAEVYDEKFTDILAVEDAISARVAQSLMTQLTGEQKQALAKRHTDSVEAYRLYSLGQFFMRKRTRASFDKAISYYEQAIAEDPDYALAYAGLAQSYALLPVSSDVPTGEILPKALAAATRALTLDESIAEAHMAMESIKFWMEWDWEGAEKAVKRAIELNPNHPFAHFQYAHRLSNVGRHEEALREINRAVELDPASAMMNTFAGQFLYQARRYDEAASQIQRALELDANDWIAHLVLGGVYKQKRMYEESIAEYRRAQELSPASSDPLMKIGHTLAVAGRKEEALEILSQLQERGKQRYVPPYRFAFIYAGLGDRTRALEWLEKAYEERDVRMVFLKIEPAWDGYRGDARFQALVRRLELE